MTLHKGRYGPYAKHGKINATLPDHLTTEDITLEQAVELLEVQAAKKGKKTAAKKSPAKKKAAKKAAAKKTGGKKATAKKTGAKKAASKKTTKSGTAKDPAGETGQAAKAKTGSTAEAAE